MTPLPIPAWLLAVGQWIIDRLLPPVVGELFKPHGRPGAPPRETIRPHCYRASWNVASIGGKPAMQFSCDWRITNIVDTPIELFEIRPRMPVRLRRLMPWLARPTASVELLIVRHPRTNLYDETHPILPHATSDARGMFFVQPPIRKVGEDLVLDIEMLDQFQNRHRIRRVRFVGPSVPKPDQSPPPEALHSLSSQLEKDAAAVLKNELTRYSIHGRPTGGFGSVGLKGRQGIPTEYQRLGVTGEQLLEGTPIAGIITSDNVTALLDRYSRLPTEDDRAALRHCLLARLSRDTEYSSVGYLVMLFFLRIGRLADALDKAKQDLMGDERHGFSDLLRLLDYLLRYEHSEFNDELLDTIETFVDGLHDHTFRIRDRIAAIRASRLRVSPPASA